MQQHSQNILCPMFLFKTPVAKVNKNLFLQSLTRKKKSLNKCSKLYIIPKPKYTYIHGTRFKLTKLIQIYKKILIVESMALCLINIV